jgi:acetyl esterase/lipase
MSTNKAPHVPGPYIIPIDYDALYEMQEPPEYEPFDVYGFFLLSVASQETPMVANPWMPIPERVIKTSDVIYKEIGDIKLGLDVYQPKGDGTPNPLILIIHGGYWTTGDKSVRISNEVEFAELGYTVASINYRLSGEHKFPAAIEDIRDGIKYLTKHAAEFNIDPEQMVIYGGSAGGHLSAFVGLAANTPGKSYIEGINPAAVKGIISLYGMHDLTLPIQREHPFTEQFIGMSYEKDPETYREASPVSHVDKNDPPVLLVHGSLDGSVSVQNSDALSKKLEEVGVPYTFDRVEGWSHGMDLFSPIGERTLWHIYQFLKTYVPSDELKGSE